MVTGCPGPDADNSSSSFVTTRQLLGVFGYKGVPLYVGTPPVKDVGGISPSGIDGSLQSKASNPTKFGRFGISSVSPEELVLSTVFTSIIVTHSSDTFPELSTAT